jgi:hypothetical protein
METNSLYTILYTSHALKAFNKVELAAIVNESRIWNHAHDITGCLAYVEGTISDHVLCQFIQVLEGKESEVKDIFNKIQSDVRHLDVSVIKEGVIGKRKFSDWRMGFEEIQLNDNPLLQSFFSMDNTILAESGDTEDHILMQFMKSFCDQKTHNGVMESDIIIG